MQQDKDSDYHDRILQHQDSTNTTEEISAAAAKTTTTTTTTTTTELTSDDGTEIALLSSKMGEILQIAQSYDTNMNLYRNNCRIFCANMEREVERVNQQANTRYTSNHTVTSTAILSQKNNNNNNNELLGRTTTPTSMILADCRWILRSFFATLLPALYPLAAIAMLYEGVIRI